MHPKISIIVLNWNTKEFLKNCIGSIRKHINIDTNSYEIIVVDNGSSDGSAKMIKTCFPHVKLIRINANLGFSRGNNIGARHATGKYLLFLNSDTLFIKDTDIQYLIAKIEQDKQIGIITCQLLNYDGSIQKSVRNFPSPLGIFFHHIGLAAVLSKLFRNSIVFNKYLNLNWDHGSEKFVNQPAGAFLIIERELFYTIGGFDEKYFIYFDDVDLCKKTILFGKKIFFAPKSKIIHLGGESEKQVKGGHFFERNKNLILYFRKYHSPKEVLLIKFALFFSIFLRILDRFLRGIFYKEFLYLLREQIRLLVKMWRL